MNIELSKLTPDLTEDYVFFLMRTVITRTINPKSATVCGLAMIPKTGPLSIVFCLLQPKEGNMPSKKSKATAYKVILPIVMIKSWDGVMPIRKLIA